MRPRLEQPWLLRLLRLWREEGIGYVYRRARLRLRPIRSYDPDWIKANDALTPSDIQKIQARIAAFTQRPLISLLLPLLGTRADDVRRSVQSVLAQAYGRWELCIVDGGTSAPDVWSLVESFAASDRRIKAAHCASREDAFAATARSLALAAGDYAALLGPGDLLAPHALYMMAEAINAFPATNIIYSDEDRIDPSGLRSDPQFKSDWNPDLFLSQNYLGRLVTYRRDLVTQVGGFRREFDECLDYDLTLRVIERSPDATIRHLPWVLYHARSTTATNDRARNVRALEQERQALREHLARKGISATVEPSRSGKFHRVRRHLPARPARVSLIIPTRDRVSLLRAAVESILARTDYPHYEIVVIDNQSSEPATLSYFDSLAGRPRVRILRYDFPFNYSAVNNFGAAHCSSELLGFLNSDIEAIHADWLGEMVSHALRPEVGAVGPMLYYPGGTIQSAGILVGVDGTAGSCSTDLSRSELPARYELIQNYSAVTGACLLTRAELFAAVGGFNEDDLPVAYNDVDYCLRLGERGYLVTWTPYAELLHHEMASRGSDTTRQKAARFRREQRYMARRWSHVMRNDPYYNPNLSRAADMFALSPERRCPAPWSV